VVIQSDLVFTGSTSTVKTKKIDSQLILLLLDPLRKVHPKKSATFLKELFRNNHISAAKDEL